MKRQASTLDSETALRLAGQASRKARRWQAALTGVGDDLPALVRLVRAWATGTYTEIPWRSITLAVAALVYFVNPMDAIPDPFPGIGFVDDVSVIAFVVGVVRSDIRRFVRWEKERRSRRHGPVRLAVS